MWKVGVQIGRAWMAVAERTPEPLFGGPATVTPGAAYRFVSAGRWPSPGGSGGCSRSTTRRSGSCTARGRCSASWQAASKRCSSACSSPSPTARSELAGVTGMDAPDRTRRTAKLRSLSLATLSKRYSPQVTPDDRVGCRRRRPVGCRHCDQIRARKSLGRWGRCCREAVSSAWRHSAVRRDVVGIRLRRSRRRRTSGRGSVPDLVGGPSMGDWRGSRRPLPKRPTPRTRPWWLSSEPAAPTPVVHVPSHVVTSSLVQASRSSSPAGKACGQG